jgi:hypothetical protein
VQPVQKRSSFFTFFPSFASVMINTQVVGVVAFYMVAALIGSLKQKPEILSRADGAFTDGLGQ